MMKKFKLISALCAVLLTVSLLGAPLGAFASTYIPDSVSLLAEEKLSTRNGPGTQYRETGSFDFRGEYVTVLSREWDRGDVCWVECELESKGKLVRVYTGLKRFHCPDPDVIPCADPLGYAAKALKTVRALYGPGPEYVKYDQLTMNKGQKVTLQRVEGDYAQVDWTTTKRSYRVWVPLDAIHCDAL